MFEHTSHVQHRLTSSTSRGNRPPGSKHLHNSPQRFRGQGTSCLLACGDTDLEPIFSSFYSPSPALPGNLHILCYTLRLPPFLPFSRFGHSCRQGSTDSHPLETGAGMCRSLITLSLAQPSWDIYHIHVVRWLIEKSRQTHT